MRISAIDLMDLLIGLVIGESSREETIEKAYNKEIQLWDQGELIYIKDIEMCLKGIRKASPTIFENIKIHSLEPHPTEKITSDKWIAERIEDIRKNLRTLTQNHERT